MCGGGGAAGVKGVRRYAGTDAAVMTPLDVALGGGDAGLADGALVPRLARAAEAAPAAFEAVCVAARASAEAWV